MTRVGGISSVERALGIAELLEMILKEVIRPEPYQFPAYHNLCAPIRVSQTWFNVGIRILWREPTHQVLRAIEDDERRALYASKARTLIFRLGNIRARSPPYWRAYPEAEAPYLSVVERYKHLTPNVISSITCLENIYIGLATDQRMPIEDDYDSYHASDNFLHLQAGDEFLDFEPGKLLLKNNPAVHELTIQHATSTFSEQLADYLAAHCPCLVSLNLRWHEWDECLPDPATQFIYLLESLPQVNHINLVGRCEDPDAEFGTRLFQYLAARKNLVTFSWKHPYEDDIPLPIFEPVFNNNNQDIHGVLPDNPFASLQSLTVNCLYSADIPRFLVMSTNVTALNVRVRPAWTLRELMEDLFRPLSTLKYLRYLTVGVFTGRRDESEQDDIAFSEEEIDVLATDFAGLEELTVFHERSLDLSDGVIPDMRDVVDSRLLYKRVGNQPHTGPEPFEIY